MSIYALNIVKNGMLTVSSIWKEYAKLEQKKKTVDMVDCDLCPSREQIAILYTNDAAYLYDFYSSSKICFDILIEWIDVLYTEKQSQARRILYFPSASHKIAICGDNGLTIWKGKHIPLMESEYLTHTKWEVIKEISGAFTTMQFSNDGKFLTLASCYAAAIEILDCNTEHLVALSKIHTTIREIMWSPQSHYMVATSPQKEFRVYETGHYTNDKWENFSNPVKVSDLYILLDNLLY